jgi:hypothetical protein
MSAMHIQQPFSPCQATRPSSRLASLLLRWAARITSLITLGLLAWFMIGEGFDPWKPHARDWTLMIFFPFGLLQGLLLGWPREQLGGAIAVASLAGFYLVHLAVAGSFPKGAAFLVFTLPGFLFLASAWVGRSRPTAQN